MGFEKQLVGYLNLFDSILWGRFLIVLFVGLGLYLTVRLRGMQFRYLFYSLKLAFTHRDPDARGDVSHFQALMTALAATLGISSIAGVATAVIAGGFGAIFWMWVIAIIGMVTKYSEALLAIKFRITGKNNEMSGGPMYYISRGLGWKWLGGSFAVFGALAAFGGGNMTQSNSITCAIREMSGLSPVWCGLVLTVATALVILKGIKSIGKVCAALVPVMAVMYLGSGFLVLSAHLDKVGPAFLCIIKTAFTGQAAIGGFLGATVMAAVQMGAARGISSNESGLGSAPIAAAAAKTDVPGRQALISMSGVFLSSLVMCTITALVLYVTGVVGKVDGNGAVLNGASLVMAAFRSVVPGSEILVAIGLFLFGFTTIVGWAYYGEKCWGYLTKERSVVFYRFLFCSFVFFGSVLSLDVVWPIADIMNGFMALPNLIGLVMLSGVILNESQAFFSLLKQEKSLANS
jgi:AGCS family alanine or glycine:cation symporter